MFVVTQTLVQFVVPNVIKHKILREFVSILPALTPSVCLLGLFFTLWWLDCVFNFLWPLLHQRLALPDFSKVTEQCSIVRLFRLWDNIILFCLRAVGLNCNSTLIRELKNFEVLGSILQRWFCDRNLETFLSPPPLYPNLEAQGSRTWEKSKPSEDLALPMNTTVTLWTDR